MAKTKSKKKILKKNSAKTAQKKSMKKKKVTSKASKTGTAKKKRQVSQSSTRTRSSSRTISSAAKKKTKVIGRARKRKAILARAVIEKSPILVPVPLPVSGRSERHDEPSDRSSHLEKVKQLFESAPISRHLGMLLGYCENGVARVRLPFRPEFMEGHGTVHGGLIGLVADTAGSFAVGSVSPGSTVKTVEFKLSLLGTVQGELLAIGEVVRKGRTLATCRLEVVEGNDRVIAIGLGTYVLQAV